MTNLADVNFDPVIFTRYTMDAVRKRSAFWQSSAIADVDLGIGAGGTHVNVPSFDGMREAAQVTVDDAPVTVNSLSTFNQTSPILTRRNAWGVNDMVDSRTGEEVVDLIFPRVASFWERELNSTAVAAALGSAGAVDAGAGDVVNDVTALTGGAEILSAAALIDTQAFGGEYADEYNLLIVHPQVRAKMRQLNLTDSLPLADQTLGEFFQGMRIIVTSDLAPTGVGSDEYSSLLVRPNSFAYSEGGIVPAKQVEFDRDAKAEVDALIVRKRFVLHPFACAYTGTYAAVNGASPTNTALATAGNWSLQAADKIAYGVRVLKHKI